MKTRFLIALFTAVIASAAHAGPRTSANYSITTDTTDSGGARATSTAYTNDGSAGGASGLSSVASPSETAKSGYLGQLYEVTALQLAASPTTVNEGETRQLSGWEAVDDGSINALPATSITWSVMAGPFTGIDASGLATAAIVYEDTLATVQGDHGGLTGTLDLTVLNVNSDDLPGYNGDGIDDAWQFQYFGLNNPLAAPGIDADFDGQDNLFEFTAGIVPTDPNSRFLLRSTTTPGQPGQMNLIISPRLPDRIYTVKTSPTLGSLATWTDLTTFTFSDNGNERTITDTAATGPRKFYQVQIGMP